MLSRVCVAISDPRVRMLPHPLNYPFLGKSMMYLDHSLLTGLEWTVSKGRTSVTLCADERNSKQPLLPCRSTDSHKEFSRLQSARLLFDRHF